mmetsp:Transcript_19800/g.57450  ORF Transcript_19800/g.57450 Transcript_19800/m.57450 type:complete len:562 (+) Transcript_19800:3-1688(+)
MKCVLMGSYCAACPNNHIRLLNPHIDSNAFPVYFATEFVDQGKSSGYMGVSSFGFGGSNARGDIWSRALGGPRNTNPGTPLLCLNEDRIRIWSEISKQSMPEAADKGRMGDAQNSLENFDDAYVTGQVYDENDTFYLIGSYNGWTKAEKMTFLEESQSFVFAFPLGETCVEQFQMIVNKNEYFKVFPATKMADQDATILGPGIAPAGHNWVLDGRPQGLQSGTVFLITLQWDVESNQRRLTWEPSNDESVLELAAELPAYRHRYSIISSWTIWKPMEIQAARGVGPGVFETTVKIGMQRQEEFRFLRDADKMQAIYPARQRLSETDDTMPTWTWTPKGLVTVAGSAESLGFPKAGEEFTPEQLTKMKAIRPRSTLEELASRGFIAGGANQSVPVCGPDHRGYDKSFMVSGTMGDEVKITLRMADGDISVTTASAKTGTKTWTNQQAASRKKYFVTSTWNNWGFTEMHSEPAVEGGGRVHYLKARMPEEQMVAFQIVADEDTTQTIHPEMALTDQLLSQAMGPDANGEGLYWGMYVARGAVVEIKLDLSQIDKRKVVTWIMT